MTALIARIREWFSRFVPIGSGPTPDASGETSMTVIVNVSGPITINVTQERDLSVITGMLDELEAVLTSEAAQVTETIAALQAKIDAGLVTPEEMARFRDLTARAAAIYTPPEPPVDPPVEPTPEV